MADTSEKRDEERTIEPPDVLKQLRKGVVLKPGQSISSVLEQLPPDFKGKILSGIFEGQFHMQREQVPDEPVVDEVLIELDKGRSEFYLKYENMGETRWVPLNFTRWPLPDHLSTQEGMDYLSTSIFSSIDNGSLAFDTRLFYPKNLDTVFKDGNLRVIPGMQEELVSNLVRFSRTHAHFSQQGHGELFLEMMRMALSHRGEFTDRRLGVKRLAKELPTLGVRNFLIRLGSDGYLVAKADNEPDAKSGAFPIKCTQVAPGIFDIHAVNNGKWASLSDGLLDRYTSTQVDAEVPSLEQSASEYRLGLLTMFNERYEYGEWQELLARLKLAWLAPGGNKGKLSQALQFLNTHSFFAQYVASVRVEEASPEIRSIAAIRGVLHVLFEPALRAMENEKAYRKDDRSTGYIFQQAMILYTTEYVKKELEKGKKIDPALPADQWWASVGEAANEVAQKAQPISLKVLLKTHEYVAGLVDQGLSESELLQKIEQNKEELFVQAPVQWTWNTGEA